MIDKDQYQKHFIAIVHTTKSNEFDRIYSNNFVILGTHPSSVHLPRFKITHLSENYTFFSDNKGKLAARINYPTSIVDVDGYYLIPFGEMDCESFLARVDKTKVLRSMKLVDLQ